MRKVDQWENEKNNFMEWQWSSDLDVSSISFALSIEENQRKIKSKTNSLFWIMEVIARAPKQIQKES